MKRPAPLFFIFMAALLVSAQVAAASDGCYSKHLLASGDYAWLSTYQQSTMEPLVPTGTGYFLFYFTNGDNVMYKYVSPQLTTGTEYLLSSKSDQSTLATAVYGNTIAVLLNEYSNPDPLAVHSDVKITDSESWLPRIEASESVIYGHFDSNNQPLICGGATYFAGSEYVPAPNPGYLNSTHMVLTFVVTDDTPGWKVMEVEVPDGATVTVERWNFLNAWIPVNGDDQFMLSEAYLANSTSAPATVWKGANAGDPIVPSALESGDALYRIQVGVNLTSSDIYPAGYYALRITYGFSSFTVTQPFVETNYDAALYLGTIRGAEIQWQAPIYLSNALFTAGIFPEFNFNSIHDIEFDAEGNVYIAVSANVAGPVSNIPSLAHHFSCDIPDPYRFAYECATNLVVKGKITNGEFSVLESISSMPDWSALEVTSAVGRFARNYVTGEVWYAMVTNATGQPTVLCSVVYGAYGQSQYVLKNFNCSEEDWFIMSFSTHGTKVAVGMMSYDYVFELHYGDAGSTEEVELASDLDPYFGASYPKASVQFTPNGEPYLFLADSNVQGWVYAYDGQKWALDTAIDPADFKPVGTYPIMQGKSWVWVMYNWLRVSPYTDYIYAFQPSACSSGSSSSSVSSGGSSGGDSSAGQDVLRDVSEDLSEFLDTVVQAVPEPLKLPVKVTIVGLPFLLLILLLIAAGGIGGRRS